MGLDAFETEGPRTFTQKKEDEDSTTEEGTPKHKVAHVLDGQEVPEELDGRDVIKHTVEEREDKDGVTRVTCVRCKRTSSSIESMQKIDKLHRKMAD